MAGNEHNYFNYETYAGSLFSVHFPEPTTATLNLLALAGRRRK